MTKTPPTISYDAADLDGDAPHHTATVVNFVPPKSGHFTGGQRDLVTPGKILGLPIKNPPPMRRPVPGNPILLYDHRGVDSFNLDGPF